MGQKYRVYHDESKEGGYWHGLLFVPEETRERAFARLMKLREETKHYDPIGWKKVRKPGNKIYYLAEQWIRWSVGWMRVKEGNEPYFIRENKRGKDVEFVRLDERLGLKFAALWLDDSLAKMQYSQDYGAKVETTLGFILKYALKYFGFDSGAVLKSIHIDGHEHYRRKLSAQKILRRIETVHSNFILSQNELDLNQGSSNHSKGNAQSYKDCQLLQLTDLLIGAVRTCCGYEAKENKQRIAEPVLSPLKASARGEKGYRNSRWYRSFLVRKASLVDGEWQFERLPRNPYEWGETIQQELPFE